MLLNPSHEITNAGLPSDVQERYVRYKQGSRAIVAWMTKYGPEKYQGRKTLPIKQMIALGRLLCDKKDEIGVLPPDVDYYFSEVIKERAYLSEHFRKHRDQCEQDLIDTINHEHFTESMKQIRNILLTAGKPSLRIGATRYKARQSRARSSASSIAGMRNSFNHLLLQSDSFDSESQVADEEALSDTDTDITSNCSHSTEATLECACNEDEINTDFLDTQGEVGIIVEAIIFLEKFKMIVEAVRVVWEKTGQGHAPVAATSAYTNALLVKALDLVRELSTNEPDFTTFSALKQHIEALSCRCCDDIQSDVKSTMETLRALEEAEVCLQMKFATPVTTRDIDVDLTKGNTKSLILSLLAGLETVVQVRGKSQLILDSVTCINELISLIESPKNNRSLLASTTIVYLLSVSHCAYSSALPKPALIAMPRISALKMANEALATISGMIDDKTIFPCQCTNTLGYRVAQMKVELETFSKYRCWDVLMQSPLTAGNHILEIIDLCSFYGMYLLHYRQYVAAVLHTYQALVELKHLDRVSVLEEACDLFASVLYPTGVRPQTGYVSSWLRYIGARLRFKKAGKYQNHKDTWCMSVPAHTAARSAGLNIGGKNDEVKQLPKFDYASIDSMIKLKHNNWNLSAAASVALDQELQEHAGDGLSQMRSWGQEQRALTSQKTRRSRHKRTKSCQFNSSNSANDSCRKLEHALSSSFIVDETEGRSLPSSRLNMLAFFHSMTKVVSGISDATHFVDQTKATSRADSGKGQMCLCFVQTILRGADRIQDVRKRRGLDAEGSTWNKTERECVNCYKKHLITILEDAKVLGGDGGAWLWTSI